MLHIYNAIYLTLTNRAASSNKYNLFEILGSVVWGVNNDSQASHRKFAEKNQLPFPLLCDEDNSLRKHFGVPKVLGLLDGSVT